MEVLVLSKSNVHIPYISLEFAGKSFSWNSKDNAPDYFISLTHTKYTDAANKMSISLTYCPRAGQNPNELEDYIVASKGECFVTYGDFGENCETYKGLVYTYTVEFSEGFLTYNLSLISSLASYTYGQYPGAEFSVKNGDTIKDVEDEIKRIVKVYLSSSGSEFKSYIYMNSLSVDFSDKITFTSVSFPSGNPIFAIRSAVSQLKVRKLWNSEVKDLISEIKNDITNKRPLGQVLPSSGFIGMTDTSGGYDSEDKFTSKYDGVDHSLDYYVSLVVDDSGKGSGKIYVVLVEGQVEESYTFNWGTRDGEVLSWSPEFDGSYSIYGSSGKQLFGTCLSQNEVGEYGYTTFTYDFNNIVNNQVAAGIIEQAENLAINQSEIDRHYEYKATLTVLGKTKMMSLGQSVIEVNPIIAGVSHHTAGQYVVIGVEDSVSSEGFTTTYTLYKKSGELSS